MNRSPGPPVFNCAPVVAIAGIITGYIQGKECLTKCKNPGLRICKCFWFHTENITVSIRCTGLKGNIDTKCNKQEKENRHQHLIDLLNSLTNTKCQNDHRNHKSYDLPEIVSKRRCHGFKRSGKILYAHS